MKLVLASPRGFCAGVERAILTVEAAIKKFGAPLYVRYLIVHNEHVIRRLEALGAVFVKELSEVPIGAPVVYSAHGVSPAIREEAKKRNLLEIDATCGLVTRIHSAVKRYKEKGYQILLVGHKNHVEIQGTYGEAPDVTTIIESVDDVKLLNFAENALLFMTTQTTLSLDDVKEIHEAIKNRYPHIETLPTQSICYATTNRQLAVGHMIDLVDCVVVIGDKRSSNSNRLKEYASKRNKSAYLVLDDTELQRCWFEGVSVIGLTAGASTPESVVENVIQKLKEFGVNQIETSHFVDENIVFQLPKEVLNK